MSREPSDKLLIYPVLTLNMVYTVCLEKSSKLNTYTIFFLITVKNLPAYECDASDQGKGG